MASTKKQSRRQVPFGGHQLAEYALGAALIGVGLHLSGRPAVALVVGGGLIGALAIITKGPLAAVRLLPKRVHLYLDLVLALGLALSPALYLHNLQVVPIILTEAVAVVLVRMSITTEIVPRPAPERGVAPSAAASAGCEPCESCESAEVDSRLRRRCRSCRDGRPSHRICGRQGARLRCSVGCGARPRAGHRPCPPARARGSRGAARAWGGAARTRATWGARTRATWGARTRATWGARTRATWATRTRATWATRTRLRLALTGLEHRLAVAPGAWLLSRLVGTRMPGC